MQMVSFRLCPVFAFSKREIMLISKLAQAFGEGAVCYSFCCGAAHCGACLSQVSAGKALSDKLRELLEGWPWGRDAGPG